MRVQIVSVSAVEWPDLLLSLNSLKTKNPISFVDDASRGQNFNDLMRFLLLLTALRGSPELAAKGKVSPHATEHIFLGIILTIPLTDFDHYIIQSSHFAYIGIAAKNEDEWIYFISGSLQLWLSLITHHCDKMVRTTTRQMLNSLMLQFELAGLSPLFNRYRKVQLADGTFILEEIHGD